MWRINSSAYPLKDQWISVRADDCITESGMELSPYYTFEYPDFVHVFALTTDRKVLLVRQYRHGFGSSVIELPGGMVNSDDANVVAAGMRELKEETGFTAERTTIMPPLTIDPAKFRNRLHLLIAYDAVQASEPELDSGEDIEVIQATIAECIAMIDASYFPNAAHIGMLMLGLNHFGLLTFGA